jgi:hypothetical protein
MLVFPLLALLLLWNVLVGGDVLLPAKYLGGFAPWGKPGAPELTLLQWNVLQWDGMAEFYPWRLHAARSFAAGLIPLWNPYALCGTPFLANSQSAPLYPLHLLYYLPLGVSVAARMGWLAFLHLSLAGAFTYLLARDLGARPVAALCGGAAFQLSGFAVAWLELPSFISVSCWIPLVLLCLGRALRHRSGRWTAAAGAVVGLMLLAGHLQVAFYGLLAAGILWLWEAAPRWRQSRALLRSAGVGLAVLALGFALAAPQFLPSTELSRMSHRAGAPTAAGYAGYVGLAMPPQNWITLLAPDYYGLPLRGNFWGMWSYGPPNVMEYAGHVGAAALLLALLGLCLGRRVTPRVWLLAALALVALLLAAGSPLCAIFYFGVPGFAQSGSPARALVLFCLAQALLAALGVEVLLRRAEERWNSVLPPLALALVLLAGIGLVLHTSVWFGVPLHVAEVDQWLVAISVPALIRALAYAGVTALLMLLAAWLLRENAPRQRAAAVGGAALVAVAGGLLWLGDAYNLTAPEAQAYPPVPLTNALVASGARVATLNRTWSITQLPNAVLPPNASLAYGWRDASGYDSLYLGHYRRLADALAAPEGASPPENGNIVFMKQADSPLLKLLGARYLVSQRPLTQPGLTPVAGYPSGPPYVYEDEQSFAEAYSVSRWWVGDDVDAVRTLAEPGLVTPIVAEGQGIAPARAEGGAAIRPVALQRLSPGHVRATTGDSPPSLLVVTEGFAPGWKATVQPQGGPPRPVPVLRTNVAFQGILLESGPATVDLRYEPASFRLGLFAALVALALLAGTVALGPTKTAG